jgi:hypothetical protein
MVLAIGLLLDFFFIKKGAHHMFLKALPYQDQIHISFPLWIDLESKQYVGLWYHRFIK